MKRYLLWVLVLLISISMVAFFSLAGCDKAGEAEEEVTAEEEEEEVAAEEEAAEKLVIGRMMLWEIDDYQQQCLSTQIELTDFYGIELIVLDSDRDAEKERANAEDLISKEVDGVIIQSVTAASCGEIIKLFKDAGIPIVNFVGKPSEGNMLWVTIDEGAANQQAAGAGAKYWMELHPDIPLVVGALIDKESEYAMLNRINPSLAGIKAVAPDAEIIEIHMLDPGNREAVMSTFEDTILAHPEINLVIGGGSFSTLPAYTVLESIGRGTIETEVIVGIEGTYEEYLKIIDQNSSYKFTTGLTPTYSEKACFRLLMDAINGEIGIDDNIKVVVPAVVLDANTDWTEYFKEQWSIDLEEKLKEEE